MTQTPLSFFYKLNFFPRGTRTKFLCYAFGVFLIFFAGYFLFHAKEAKASGSWKYIITHGDEYGYWAFAKGAAETPYSEGNPFYYEEMGLKQTLPFPVVTLTGFLAKILGVGVLFFYPIWHIGMPFLLWLALFFCFRKIWRFSFDQSAAISILLLLSTLYLRGQGQFIIFRYSRPADGLPFLFLWISLVMNLDSRLKLRVTIASICAAASLWLHPYYIYAGILVNFFEGIWQFFVAKDRKRGLSLSLILLGLLIAGFAYGLYVITHINQAKWATEQISTAREGEVVPVIAIILYAVVIALVLISKYSIGKFSKMDRLLLFVMLIEPIAANFQILARISYTLAGHRYYFLLIEIACLIGWFAEKIPLFLSSKHFGKIEFPMAALCLLTEILILSNGRLNFFLYGPLSSPPFRTFDNALLLLEITPLIYLILWTLYRFEKIRKLFYRRSIVIAIIILLAIPGFTFLKSQLKEETRFGKFDRTFPFDGAYQWLNKNAEKNEVVLSARRTDGYEEDYLILYTDLKTYFNRVHGQMLLRNPGDKEYRILFHGYLLTGILDKVPLGGEITLEQKMRHFKLDYILLEQPAPFFEGNIVRQLDPWLRLVYQDDRCVLWKIKITS